MYGVVTLIAVGIRWCLTFRVVCINTYLLTIKRIRSSRFETNAFHAQSTDRTIDPLTRSHRLTARNPPRVRNNTADGSIYQVVEGRKVRYIRGHALKMISQCWYCSGRVHKSRAVYEGERGRDCDLGAHLWGQGQGHLTMACGCVMGRS